MFTGIIQSKGEVTSTSRNRISVRVADSRGGIGDSVAINGVCLTITRQLGKAPNRVLYFDLSDETKDKTTLSDLKTRDAVHVEHPLRLSDELGGHLVQGHVDGVGRVTEAKPDKAGGLVLWFSAPKDIFQYLVPKGSVTVDGVSLTVVETRKEQFSVALIPHTLSKTNLGTRKKGDRVNLEADVIAKYVAKYVQRI